MSKFPLLQGYYYHAALAQKQEGIVEYYLNKCAVDVNCPYVSEKVTF